MWQPIETAPKDGTQILLFCPKFGVPVRLGYWVDTKHYNNGKLTYSSARWFVGGFVSGDPEPTQWMPLPNPPPHQYLGIDSHSRE